MGRIRSIKPEFFDDPDVAELSLAARLFFIGLWTEADRDGRLVDDMRRLKVRIFPFDAVDVEALAVELQAKGMIERYQTGDKYGYLAIVHFLKHQKPHPNELPSVLPACPPCDAKTGTKTMTSTKGTHASTKGRSASTKGTHASTIGRPNQPLALALALALPSLALTEAAAVKDSCASPPAPRVSDARFDAFWDAYPKKRAKEEARKAWTKCRPTDAFLADVLAALTRQRGSPDWQKAGGQFIPYAATWLHRGQWTDDATPIVSDGLSDLMRRNLAASAEAHELILENERRRTQTLVVETEDRRHPYGNH